MSSFAEMEEAGFVPIWREDVLPVLQEAGIELAKVPLEAGNWWLTRAAKIDGMSAFGPRWAVELVSEIINGAGVDGTPRVAAAVLLAVKDDPVLFAAVDTVSRTAGLAAVKSLLRAHRPDLLSLLSG